jgi:protease-4
VGGETAASLIREAREDDNVKAIVLRVDSPGGSVFASEQIYREVRAAQADGKPVIVSMGDLAASGGYYIASSADEIWAHPATITGSIGIFGAIPTFQNTLKKIGVHTDGVGTTPFAGAFDLTRPLDPRVGEVIQSVIDKGYRDFTGRVAKARHQSVAQVDAIARGRVWSGAQAKERGLVDAFGGLADAIADAAKEAKLGKPGSWRTRYIEKPMTPFERFFLRLSGTDAGAAWLRESALARALVEHAAPHSRADFRLLDAALKPRPGVPVKALAHCFCGL